MLELELNPIVFKLYSKDSPGDLQRCSRAALWLSKQGEARQAAMQALHPFQSHSFYLFYILGCNVRLPFFKDFIYLLLERGREGERERNISVWLPLMHPALGTCPVTQARALTGN